MNILYTSQKLQELFCDDHLPVHANASGDGDGVPGRCCRLCGGDTNLRYFGDTYVWEGVEERYDKLLFDCFGVKFYKQRPQKFQCTRCPKKYAMAKNLVLHVRNAHGDSLDTLGPGNKNSLLSSVCGQNMVTRDKLESPLTHGSPHQCNECLLIFKNRRALVAHSTSHHLKSTSS
ncbi:hypothetical protein HF086_016060 [Spodoptera exigua]|uniref:C2H2-type domain-containing protein n=1 Tax=Spodoptera exigua TaxID=7107 RepID=A0A922S9Y1_SPOEX|nr:hypothetical protein HF086_016060 [Spodoptera exigua]